MKNYMDFKAFRKDVNKALEEVAKKYGITLESGNISYDANSFTMKLNGKRGDVDVDRINFENGVKYMPGITADDYRRQVKLNGKDYVIIGVKPGNKFSIICERSDGKQYGFTLAAILQALGKEVPDYLR